MRACRVENIFLASFCFTVRTGRPIAFQHLKEEIKIKHLSTFVSRLCEYLLQGLIFQKKIVEDFCFSSARPLVSSYVKWDKMHPHYLCLCNIFSHCSEPARNLKSLHLSFCTTRGLCFRLCSGTHVAALGVKVRHHLTIHDPKILRYDVDLALINVAGKIISLPHTAGVPSPKLWD